MIAKPETLVRMEAEAEAYANEHASDVLLDLLENPNNRRSIMIAALRTAVLRGVYKGYVARVAEERTP